MLRALVLRRGELRAGTVTFLTMAYILAVNPSIVADTGGPCSIYDCAPPNTGKPFCMFGTGAGFDPGYMACVVSSFVCHFRGSACTAVSASFLLVCAVADSLSVCPRDTQLRLQPKHGTDHGCAIPHYHAQAEAKRSMINATAIATFVACVLMGLLANVPFGIAPAMGINAFFTYTVVGFFGDGGMISYQEALAAAFIEGWIFFVISITGLRTRLTQVVPKCIMLATSGGIGLFLTFIGLQGAEGIGAIAFEPATLVTLGGCPVSDRAHM